MPCVTTSLVTVGAQRADSLRHASFIYCQRCDNDDDGDGAAYGQSTKFWIKLLLSLRFVSIVSEKEKCCARGIGEMAKSKNKLFIFYQPQLFVCTKEIRRLWWRKVCCSIVEVCRSCRRRCWGRHRGGKNAFIHKIMYHVVVFRQHPKFDNWISVWLTTWK